MALTLRKSQDRGSADYGWLKTRYSFSFADYHDPAFMGFSTLRVINEDVIAGGGGFDTHPHRDMEIISYVVQGSLEHKDSMGNVTVIVPDEVQVMSAGTGVRHSEANHSKTESAHLFQIWIMPKTKGIPPRYGQKSFKNELVKGDLVLVVSPEGRDGSIAINQEADMYIGRLKADSEKELSLRAGRQVWVQVIKGELSLNNHKIGAGDGVAVSDEKALAIKSLKDSEIILFDLS